MMVKFTNAQISGIILAISSTLSFAVILHHPTISAHELSLQVAENANEMTINGLVHGGLIGCLLVNLLAFTLYSNHRGMANISVLAAFLMYSSSALLMIIAALINGFVYPQFLQQIACCQPDLLEYTPLIKTFSWNVNQTLASASVIGTAIATACWSINLLRSFGIQKLVALCGLTMGSGVSVAIVTGWLTLNLFGMTIVVCVLGMWNVALAYLLFFKKLNDK